MGVDRDTVAGLTLAVGQAGGVGDEFSDRVSDHPSGCEPGIGEDLMKRVFVDDHIHDDFCDRLPPRVGILSDGGAAGPEDPDERIMTTLPSGTPQRMVDGVITMFGGAGGDVSIELLLAGQVEDRDDLGRGDRVTTDHRHIQLGAVDEDVGVAMLDRGVPIQMGAVFVGLGDHVGDGDLEVFEQQLFGVQQQEWQELVEDVPDPQIGMKRL